MDQACHLWEWCLHKGITVSAEYLPGQENWIADKESQWIQTAVEWKLHGEVFSLIQKVLGPCQIDLFASRLNNQLRGYVSWKPDPFAVATDAFQLSWNHRLGYAFPPFALIGKCAQKVRKEQSTIVLVTFLWKAQTWFPVLLDLAVECPLALPKRRYLLNDHLNRLHPLAGQGSLQLVTWKVSGDISRQQEFLSKLQNYWLQGGAEAQTQLMSQPGSGGLVGVIQGRWIPFHVESTHS